MIQSLQEKVPFFTPVESNEKPFLPVIKVFDHYLSFGNEVAVQQEGREPIEGSRVCRKELRNSNCVATMVKIVTYILSLGIFPLIALIVKAITRCAYHFHYESRQVARISNEEELPAVVATATVKPSLQPAFNDDTTISKSATVQEITTVNTSRQPVLNDFAPKARLNSEKTTAIAPAPLQPALSDFSPITETSPLDSPANTEEEEYSQNDSFYEPVASDEVFLSPPPKPGIKRLIASVEEEIESDSSDEDVPSPPPSLGSKKVSDSAHSILAPKKLFSSDISRRPPIPLAPLPTELPPPGLSLAAQAVKQWTREQAKAHFQDMTFVALETALKTGKTRIKDEAFELNEKSLQVVRELIPEQATPFFQKMGFETLESFVSGRELGVVLSDTAVEAARKLLPEKAKAYFRGKPEAILQGVALGGIARVDSQVINLTPDVLSAVRELVAEKNENAALRYPTIQPRLSSATTAVLAPMTGEQAKVHFQNESLPILEEALRKRKAMVSNESIDLSDDAVREIRKLLPEKVKVHFEGASRFKLQLAVDYRKAPFNEFFPLMTTVKEDFGLSDESVQALEALIAIEQDIDSDSDDDTETQVIAAPAILKPAEAILSPAPAEPKEERAPSEISSLLSPQEIVSTYFQHQGLAALQDAIRDRQGLMFEKMRTFSEEEVAAIRKTLERRVREHFDRKPLLALEKILNSGNAYIDAKWVKLIPESIAVIQELIPRIATAYFQGKDLAFLNEALKNRKAEVFSEMIELSEASLQAIRALIPEKAKDEFKNIHIDQLGKTGLSRDWIASVELQQAIQEVVIPEIVKIKHSQNSFSLLQQALNDKAPLSYGNNREGVIKGIKAVLADKIKQKFLNTQIPELEDIVESGRATVDFTSVQLSQTAIEIFQDLIAEKYNAMPANKN